MLERERQVYQQHLEEWLTRYPGKFVLLHSGELIGVFDTMNEGLAAGARRFGLQPFLLRQVMPVPETVCVPALTLGILHADPTCAIRG